MKIKIKASKGGGGGGGGRGRARILNMSINEYVQQTTRYHNLREIWHHLRLKRLLIIPLT